MRTDEHEQVIGDLENLIAETRSTLIRFEETGMDESMPTDSQQPQDIHTKIVIDLRTYTPAMLDLPAAIPMTGEE